MSERVKDFGDGWSIFAAPDYVALWGPNQFMETFPIIPLLVTPERATRRALRRMVKLQRGAMANVTDRVRREVELWEAERWCYEL